MLAGVARKEAIARAQQILVNLGLEGAGPYRPGQLSGGQAQRVAIGARSLPIPKSSLPMNRRRFGSKHRRGGHGCADLCLPKHQGELDSGDP